MVDVGTGWPGLGDLTDEATAAGCGTLAPGASCTFWVTITAPASPNTLRNDVTVLYHPDGFPNDVGGTDVHTPFPGMPKFARVEHPGKRESADGSA